MHANRLNGLSDHLPADLPHSPSAPAPGKPGKPGRTGNAGRRKARKPLAGEVRGHEILIPDDLWEQIRVTAGRKRCSTSTVVVELLAQHLQRYRIERDE